MGINQATVAKHHHDTYWTHGWNSHQLVSSVRGEAANLWLQIQTHVVLVQLHELPHRLKAVALIEVAITFA